MVAAARIRARRAGVPGPRGGGVHVSGLQRARLLDATFAVVAEQGYRRMTVRKVSGWAGVSNKTFYDLFSDREDCFLAAFDDAVRRLTEVVLVGWEGEREWTARVRAGLGVLLCMLDERPELRQLVFIEALGAGPRVLTRRAEVLEGLAAAIDGGRAGVKVGQALPPLTAEGLVGAAFGVIYARLIAPEPPSLMGLLNALMATIVLPYRGHPAAARELARLASPLVGAQAGGGKSLAQAERVRASDFRLTVRTHMVLSAVATLSGRGSDPSNREISDLAAINDQGQISKLLARLEGHGLLLNTGPQTPGAPNAWQLTAQGENLIHTTQSHGPQSGQENQMQIEAARPIEHARPSENAVKEGI